MFAWIENYENYILPAQWNTAVIAIIMLLRGQCHTNFGMTWFFSICCHKKWTLNYVCKYVPPSACSSILVSLELVFKYWLTLSLLLIIGISSLFLISQPPRPRIKVLTRSWASGSGKLLDFLISPLLLSSSLFLDCHKTGVGGVCWYEVVVELGGVFFPRFDHVVNLPGDSRLLSLKRLSMALQESGKQ